jgi:pyruvate/2-oxoglutarate/acetoin dehydrogenase E1 component
MRPSGLRYFDELTAAMETLSMDPRVVFMGQAVACEGTAMSKTLVQVPVERRLELPVAEDMQMGMATGMSLAGLVPVCIYPRWNFLLLAMSQLVLHLDKLRVMSVGGFDPKVIIRTAVATPRPLYPGPQHLGDYTQALARMLDHVNIVLLENVAQIVPAYERALARGGSTLLVELADQY